MHMENYYFILKSLSQEGTLPIIWVTWPLKPEEQIWFPAQNRFGKYIMEKIAEVCIIFQEEILCMVLILTPTNHPGLHLIPGQDVPLYSSQKEQQIADYHGPF